MRRTDCPTPNFSTVTGLAMMLREYTRGDVIQKAHARHTTSRDRLPRSRVRMPRGRSLRPARCSDQAPRGNALGALRDALPGVVRSRRGRRPDYAASRDLQLRAHARGLARQVRAAMEERVTFVSGG